MSTINSNTKLFNKVPLGVMQMRNEPLTTSDMVRAYLHEIGRIPLLSYEQEIYLAKQVQLMMTALAQKEELSKKLQHEPTLREWAESINLSEEISTLR